MQFKCYTCGGVRVYGDGNPSKARYGFIGKTFYFCHGCGEVLTLENRAADMKKIALRIRDQGGPTRDCFAPKRD